jgi:hypothetical protein
MSRLLPAIAAVVLALPGIAAAQSYDPTARSDLREPVFRERPVRTGFRAAEMAPLFQLSGSLGGTITSNVGQSHDQEVRAGYVTPGLELDFNPLQGAWSLTAVASYDGDYFPDADKEAFAESRLTGLVKLDRTLSDTQQLELNYQVLGGYTQGFGKRRYDFERLGAKYTWTPGSMKLSAGFDYDFSTVPELRRERVDGSFKYKFGSLDPGKSELAFTVSTVYSAFRAGANDGAHDLLAQGGVSVTIPLSSKGGDGPTASLEVDYAHRFSNRVARRFDSVQVGPSLSLPFG